MSTSENSAASLTKDHGVSKETRDALREMSSTVAVKGLLLIQLLNEIESQAARIRELDPDPVVCGCREASCPHTPIAKLPRNELVKHFREQVASLERDKVSLEKDAARYRYVRTLHVPQFQNLFNTALQTGRPFDDLVDSSIANAQRKP